MSNVRDRISVWAWVPHALTLGNLFCGCLGVVGVLNGGEDWGAACILVAAVLDLADGAVARALGVESPLGKELDSLADVVSFGVLPGAMAFGYARGLLPAFGASPWPLPSHGFWPFEAIPSGTESWWLLCFAAIPLASALRLALFNANNNQSRRFVGMPTPAHALWWYSFLQALPSWPMDWVLHLKAWHLGLAALTSAACMLLPVPALSLKYQPGQVRSNRATLLTLSCVLIAVGLAQWTGLWLVLLLYLPYSWCMVRFYLRDS